MDRTLYPDYTEEWDSKRFRAVLDSVIRPHHTVLDYGAGRGAVAALNLRGRARLVCGVDPDDAVLRNPFLDDARVLLLPGGRIPYDDGTFDVIFSSNVLEHVLDPSTWFRQAYRVLKPGGILLAKTPSKWHYVSVVARLTPQVFHVWVNRKRGRDPRETFPTVYRCNTARAVQRNARQAGFEVVWMERWEGRPEYLRAVAVLYLLGWVYERIVNASPLFSAVRSVLVFALRKPEGG